jgi:hypothetical protein
MGAADLTAERRGVRTVFGEDFQTPKLALRSVEVSRAGRRANSNACVFAFSFAGDIQPESCLKGVSFSFHAAAWPLRLDIDGPLRFR